MTRTEKIEMAAERLGGVTEWNGRQVYLAEEVDSYYYVSDDDLVELADLMADAEADDDGPRDPYTKWRASYGDEVPTDEQVKIRDYCDA